jgi:hypothetical protein
MGKGLMPCSVSLADLVPSKSKQGLKIRSHIKVCIMVTHLAEKMEEV